MKAVTKSKRRVTLSICGLGMLDESEADSIRGVIYTKEPIHPDTSEVWRTWKSPVDAVLWGSKQLPGMSLDQIQAEFNALEAIGGKKAPRWVQRVLELREEF